MTLTDLLTAIGKEVGDNVDRLDLLLSGLSDLAFDDNEELEDLGNEAESHLETAKYQLDETLSMVQEMVLRLK